MTMPSGAATSGDLLADRRYLYGQALLRDGDPAGAADLARQVIERVADWIPGWLQLGFALERAGDKNAAIAAFDHAAALDSTGIFGARFHAARLRGDAAAVDLPRAYVRALFDDYAPRFDRHLVDTLDYRGPAVLREALAQVRNPFGFGKALDLGCGTGLMARALRGDVGTIDGVDLSPGMVHRAEATGLYRHLAVGEIGDHLARLAPGAYDLIVAADVFVYLGALDEVLHQASRVLCCGGLIAFTAQRGEGSAIRLGEDLRYAHSRAYLHAALEAAGLRVERIEERSTRQDRGIAVPGLVLVAAKP